MNKAYNGAGAVLSQSRYSVALYEILFIQEAPKAKPKEPPKEKPVEDPYFETEEYEVESIEIKIIGSLIQ